eukprot:794778-Amorphochlora_amoeboformis.AAC.2
MNHKHGTNPTSNDLSPFLRTLPSEYPRFRTQYNPSYAGRRLVNCGGVLFCHRWGAGGGPWGR